MCCPNWAGTLKQRQTKNNLVHFSNKYVCYMDRLTLHQRHKNMASIRSANTKPEILVRKYLWSHGFRYRLNNPRLPGHPDLVLRKYRTCVFVNGCFWHGHDNCKYFHLPKTNIDCRGSIILWFKRLNFIERDNEIIFLFAGLRIL